MTPKSAYTAALALCLSGCATLSSQALHNDATEPAAPWQAPLPDQTRGAALQAWWQAQNEPELTDLIATAQKVSPDIASAQVRIAQAQAQQAQAWASDLPQINATASTTRTYSPAQTPALAQRQAGLQISWAVDLASFQGAGHVSAAAQLEAAQALWHDARTLVAAEVADQYHSVRTCRHQLRLLEADASSREQSRVMTEQATRFGMRSQIDLASAQSLASDSRANVVQQQATCEASVKALVALTGLPEPDLRTRLASAQSRVPSPTPFAITAVPAQALMQRPDVYVAERDVLQAQAKRLQTQAARLPRLSLDGFVGRARVQSGSTDVSGPSWTFGPMALTLPLFDAGLRSAQQHTADVELEAAQVRFQSKVRQAVREVEEALLQLHSAEQRWQEGQLRSQRAHTQLDANARLLEQGMLSQIDFEDIRRQTWSADRIALALNLERHRAWLTLYRAVGGGFTANHPAE